MQISVIFAVSLLVFLPSFSLALFGDDWLAFFRFRQHVDPGTGRWTPIRYYLTPYGPQDILMGVLRKIYGFNSTYYYLTSFIFRLIAAFSFYPLVLKLTKNQLSAFFASLFFSITVIGLDTTNWVFNMPTYITIALFNFFLYFFLSAREEGKSKLLVMSGLLYYLAYVTTPIRMHGSLLFIFLVEAFWFLQERNSQTLKKVFIRLGVILLVFLIIKYTGTSLGPASEIGERFNLGIKSDLMLLSQGRFDFLFFPILMFGSMIIPDFFLPQVELTSLRMLIPTLSFVFLIFLIFFFFILKNVEKFKQKVFIKIILLSAFWTSFVILINRLNPATFSNSYFIISTLIGGYSLIVSLFLIFIYWKQKLISFLLFLSIAWSILSFFFAWWWVPLSIFPTTYRYLIVSAVGITLLFSTLISLPHKKNNQIFIFGLMSIFLLINVFGSLRFFNQTAITHGQEITNKVWGSIPYFPQIKKQKEPLIFYFEGDGTNGGILHDVITFGFPPHMALIYDLSEGQQIPVPMSDFKDVVSAVQSGKPMPAYGYKAEPVNIERIYAFHLKGDQLINITYQTRNKISEAISETK